MTMQLIETKTLGSNANTISFTNVPQTSTDLLILCSLRLSDNNVAQSVLLSFNSGAQGNVFSQRWLTGDGSLVGGGSYTDIGGFYPFYASGATATSNTFGNGAIYIPNYTASASRSLISEGVTENNGTQVRMEIGGAVFASTAAITTITLQAGAGDFVTNTTVSLYGITKA